MKQPVVVVDAGGIAVGGETPIVRFVRVVAVLEGTGYPQDAGQIEILQPLPGQRNSLLSAVDSETGDHRGPVGVDTGLGSDAPWRHGVFDEHRPVV